MTTLEDRARTGFLAAASAYTLWGLLPAYLKLAAFAAPLEVLAHRILWSLPAAALGVALMGGWRQARAAWSSRGVLAALALSAGLIAVNWGLYVVAVADGRIIEASLAYFLTPLVNVAFGVILFKERLSRLQGVALAFAAAGVAVQFGALESAPWIALGLCATWSVYGLVRKQAPVPASAGLLAETALLAFPAAGVLVWFASQDRLAAAAGPDQLLILALAGPATALPLILFTFGARRLRFSTLGLLQYIAPTLQFCLGVAYGEPLTALRLVSFALIWMGLALFSLDALRRERRVEPAA